MLHNYHKMIILLLESNDPTDVRIQGLPQLLYKLELSSKDIRAKLRAFKHKLETVIMLCEKDQFPKVSFIGLPITPTTEKILISYLLAQLIPVVLVALNSLRV